MKYLKKKSTIGLISPAGVASKEKVEIAVKNIENLGFEAFYLNSIFEKDNYLAGNDISRLNELHYMFDNKHIDAVFCVRGGYGTMRLLPKINYDLIRKNAKPLIGYSDITALLQAIYKKSQVLGFHGVVGASDFDEYTKNQFQNIFLSSEKEVIIRSENSLENNFKICGKASGILAGGNLSLLVSLLGTPYDISWKNKIIFIEDVNEPIYKLDRMLTQLKLAGKFNEVSALVFGQFADCENFNDFSVDNLLSSFFSDAKFPIISNFSFGHVKSQAIFPVGANAILDTDNETIEFMKSPLRL